MRDGVSDLGINQSWQQRMDALDRLLGGGGGAGCWESKVKYYEQDPTRLCVVTADERDVVHSFLRGLLGHGGSWSVQQILGLPVCTIVP